MISLHTFRDSYFTLVLLLCIAFSAALMPPSARAQGAATYASLAGDVIDQNGGWVPKATVVATNVGTAISQTTQTDMNGHFIFARLQPGTYGVTVEAPSFKKWETKGVVLSVGSAETLKISLTLGESKQVVEVQAEQLQISTGESEVGNTITPLQVQDLPLNQRSFTALVTQQAGLVQITATAGATVIGAATNSGSYISGNGLPGTSVGYLVDGVNITNGTFTAPGTASAGDMPGVEAMTEFQVLTHGYSAAFGGASSAVISFSTRTGTNQYHGSVYEYLRNSAMDARDFFNYVGTEQAPYKRNQFGAALGGPIKKDKLFFFVNYEGLRQALTQTTNAFVPTQCALNSGVGGSGAGCLYSPGGPGTPEPVTIGGNPVAIPAAMQPILALYPTPNAGPLCTTPSAGCDWVGKYVFGNPEPTRQDFGIVNITYALSPKDSLSARYSITDANATQNFNLPDFEFLRRDRNQNLLLKWSHEFSAKFVNTLSVSFLRDFIDAKTAAQSLLPSQYTGNPTRAVIGAISVGNTAGTGSGSLTFLGNDDATPFHLAKNNFPVNDDAVYTAGKHTIKFGGLINRFQWNWVSGTLYGGSYTFLDVNDFLAANPLLQLIHRDGALTDFGARTTALGWYVEDAWRIKPNFTLTYGLRHDFQVPILEDVNNRLGNWQTQSATAQHVGTPYNNYSFTQFQPRMGIAYDPFNNGKTVFRAGFGIFNEFVDFAGLAQGQLQWSAPQPALNTAFGEPAGGAQIQFPTCTSCTVPGPYYGLVTSVLEPMNSPTSIQWDVEIQRQLPGKFTASIGYAGSESYHIPRKIEGNYHLPCGVDANGIPDNFGGCGSAAPAVTPIAFSLYAKTYDTTANYNAMTLQVGRSVSSLLTMQTSYTFAKAMSESDAVNSGNVLGGAIAQATQYPPEKGWDRSPSFFSIRNRFTENVVFSLPFGRGRRYMNNARGIVEGLLGGWQITSLGTFQSGQPFTVLAGFGITNVGDLNDTPDRPNIVSKNTVTGNINGWINTRAYALQAPGHLGNAPRTSAIGPNFEDLDLGLGKVFQVTERVGLTARVDTFDLLNHPNFGMPFNQLYTGINPTTGAGIPNPLAGVISTTVGVPRELQLSLKLTF